MYKTQLMPVCCAMPSRCVNVWVGLLFLYGIACSMVEVRYARVQTIDFILKDTHIRTDGFKNVNVEL